MGLITICNKKENSNYIKTLEELYIKYINNDSIALSFANGLFNLSCDQELPDRKITVGKLEALAKKNQANVKLQALFRKLEL